MITFNDENQARRRHKLSNNEESLNTTIGLLNANGVTFPSYGLDIVKRDLVKNSSNFVFILTDGDISPDLSDKDQDSEKKRTAKLLEELKSEGVQICAIRIGPKSQDSTIENHVQKYYESTNLSDDYLQEAIESFVNDVQESITIEAKALDFSDAEYINNKKDNFFNYKSTYYFNSLDAKVVSDEFINNAKALIENESRNAKATDNYIPTKSSMSSGGNSKTEYQNTGPTFYFKARPSYTLTPTITAKNATVYSSGGQKVFEDILSKETIFETMEQSDLYGSEVYINYEIEIKNESNCTNTTDSIYLISFMPDGATLLDSKKSKEYTLKLYGIDNNSKLIELKSKGLTYVEIDSKKLTEQFSSIKNNCLSDDVYKYLKQTGYSAILFNVDLKKSGFELSPGSSIRIEYTTSKKLSYDDEMSYTGFVEILKYKNSNYRRLQYNIANTANALAGNNYPKDENLEKDNAQSNNFTLLTPTGRKDNKKIIVISIVILLFLFFIVLRLKIKTKTKTIEKSRKI